MADVCFVSTIVPRLLRHACGTSLPRYTLTEDGHYIIDLFEYMARSIVFPVNASYNLNVHEKFEVSFNNQVLSSPDIVSDVFQIHSFFRSSRESETRLKTVVHDNVVTPRRSVPIYVSGNQVRVSPLCS